MNKLDKKNIEDITALTPVQEGILFHYLRNKESEQFFEQLFLEVSGALEPVIFKQAWEIVIETNEVLRTIFWWENLEKPLQVILKKSELNLKYYDYSTGSESDKKKLLQEIKIKDREKRFNPGKETPFRIILVKIETDKCAVIISNHHILYDGWSSGIILEEFLNTYHSLYFNKGVKEAKKNKFKEYVKWLHNLDKNEMRLFWQDFFKDYNHSDKPLRKKSVRDVGRNIKRKSAYYQFKFADELTKGLEGFAVKRRISLASILYAAWGILLLKYNDCEDVIFDTTLAGRSAKIRGIEHMVGLFMNTLPFRVKAGGDSILDILKNANRMLQERETVECTPLEIINPFRTGSKNQYFDSIVVIENYPLDKILMKKNDLLSIDSYAIDEITGYDLTVIITVFEGIKVQFTYDKDLFAEKGIARLSGDFIAVLKEIIAGAKKSIREIDVSRGMDIGVTVKGRGEPRIQPLKEREAVNVNVNEVERVLLDIWTGVLGAPPGIDDNFFDIGGDSISLVRLYKQINNHFPTKIKINDFFENPTVKKLGRLINRYEMTGNYNNRKKINNINF